jgi:hypothetical protein
MWGEERSKTKDNPVERDGIRTPVSDVEHRSKMVTIFRVGDVSSDR